jgi:hypothetical protein
MPLAGIQDVGGLVRSRGAGNQIAMIDRNTQSGPGLDCGGAVGYLDAAGDVEGQPCGPCDLGETDGRPRMHQMHGGRRADRRGHRSDHARRPGSLADGGDTELRSLASTAHCSRPVARWCRRTKHQAIASSTGLCCRCRVWPTLDPIRRFAAASPQTEDAKFGCWNEGAWRTYFSLCPGLGESSGIWSVIASVPGTCTPRHSPDSRIDQFAVAGKSSMPARAAINQLVITAHRLDPPFAAISQWTVALIAAPTK